MSQKDILKELDQLLQFWTSSDFGRRSFLMSVPVLLASCSSAPKTRYREGDNAGQEALLTVEDERRLTRQVMPKMRKEYPPVRDARMQSFISGVGKKLVKANGLHNRPYRYNFTAVDVPYVNAFALPAGTVFITAPLIAMADTEAELAGVVGHEIGHIQARHTAERMFRAEREKKKSWLYAVGGGLLGAAAGFGLGKLACPENDQKCLTKATALGAAAGLGGGLLIHKFAFMANSREDEMEADRIGFKTSVRAAYHKDHAGRFYAKLLRMEKQAKGNRNILIASVTDAMSTHPPSQQRVDQMNQMASQHKSQAKPIISSKDFARVRARAKIVTKRAQDRARRQKNS